MTHQQQIGRRKFLRTAGGIAIASAVAGCTGGESASAGGAGSDTGNTGSVDEWLSDTDNYNGTVTDRTDTESVTVDVGPEDNDLTFAPPAIRISPGTTVVWKWIGSGTHNVVAKDGQFKSGEPTDSGSFEQTIDQPGTVPYYCEPHKSMGMKGAVIVAGTGTGAGESNETGTNVSTGSNNTGATASNGTANSTSIEAGGSNETESDTNDGTELA